MNLLHIKSGIINLPGDALPVIFYLGGNALILVFVPLYVICLLFLLAAFKIVPAIYLEQFHYDVFLCGFLYAWDVLGVFVFVGEGDIEFFEGFVVVVVAHHLFKYFFFLSPCSRTPITPILDLRSCSTAHLLFFFFFSLFVLLCFGFNPYFLCV